MAGSQFKKETVAVREGLCRKLISAYLPTLEAQDPTNFGLAFDFVAGHLSDTALSVDPREPNDWFDSLAARFGNHSQNAKALRLRDLVAQLRSAGLQGNYLDMEARIMRLLMNLSERPLDNPYAPPPPQPLPPVEDPLQQERLRLQQLIAADGGGSDSSELVGLDDVYRPGQSDTEDEDDAVYRRQAWEQQQQDGSSTPQRAVRFQQQRQQPEKDAGVEGAAAAGADLANQPLHVDGGVADGVFRRLEGYGWQRPVLRSPALHAAPGSGLVSTLLAGRVPAPPGSLAAVRAARLPGATRQATSTPLPRICKAALCALMGLSGEGFAWSTVQCSFVLTGELQSAHHSPRALEAQLAGILAAATQLRRMDALCAQADGAGRELVLPRWLLEATQVRCGTGAVALPLTPTLRAFLQALRSCAHSVRKPLAALHQALYDASPKPAATGQHHQHHLLQQQGQPPGSAGKISSVLDLTLRTLPACRRAQALWEAATCVLQPLAAAAATHAAQQQQQGGAAGPAAAGATKPLGQLAGAQLSCLLLERLQQLNEEAWLTGSSQASGQPSEAGHARCLLLYLLLASMGPQLGSLATWLWSSSCSSCSGGASAGVAEPPQSPQAAAGQQQQQAPQHVAQRSGGGSGLEDDFFIVRGHGHVAPDSPAFWREGYDVVTLPMAPGSTGPAARDPPAGARLQAPLGLPGVPAGRRPACPTFLQPLAASIVAAGKSLRLRQRHADGSTLDGGGSGVLGDEAARRAGAAAPGHAPLPHANDMQQGSELHLAAAVAAMAQEERPDALQEGLMETILACLTTGPAAARVAAASDAGGAAAGWLGADVGASGGVQALRVQACMRASYARLQQFAEEGHGGSGAVAQANGPRTCHSPVSPLDGPNAGYASGSARSSPDHLMQAGGYGGRAQEAAGDGAWGCSSLDDGAAEGREGSQWWPQHAEALWHEQAQPQAAGQHAAGVQARASKHGDPWLRLRRHLRCAKRRPGRSAWPWDPDAACSSSLWQMRPSAYQHPALELLARRGCCGGGGAAPAVSAGLPQLCALLEAGLLQPLQDRSRHVNDALLLSLLGEWGGLEAQLAQLPALFLLAAPSARAWADRLVARLLEGVKLGDEMQENELEMALLEEIGSAAPGEGLPPPESLELRLNLALQADPPASAPAGAEPPAPQPPALAVLQGLQEWQPRTQKAFVSDGPMKTEKLLSQAVARLSPPAAQPQPRTAAAALHAAGAGGGPGGPGGSSLQQLQELQRSVGELEVLQVKLLPSWALALVADANTLATYNKPLTFMLQLSWVRAALERAHKSYSLADRRLQQQLHPTQQARQPAASALRRTSSANLTQRLNASIGAAQAAQGAQAGARHGRGHSQDGSAALTRAAGAGARPTGHAAAPLLRASAGGAGAGILGSLSQGAGRLGRSVAAWQGGRELDGGGAGEAGELVPWRVAERMLHAMLHFVAALHSWVAAQAINGAWQQLVQDMSTARSVDDVCAAHQAYVALLLWRCFRAGPKAAFMGALVRRMLDSCLLFAVALHNLSETYGKAPQAPHPLALRLWRAADDAHTAFVRAHGTFVKALSAKALLEPGSGDAELLLRLNFNGLHDKVVMTMEEMREQH